MKRIPVTLATSSVYPLSVHDGFAIAADLGYDGVEVMVTNSATSQNPIALNELASRYGQPIHSIHAPTLLLTQQVWGGAWNKILRSVKLAEQVNAEVVVVHPPFRWQGEYASQFGEGINELMDRSGIKIAVENMYPWRAGGQEARMYLPHWNPIDRNYRHVTWDFSHAAIAGVDSHQAFQRLRERLAHVHLTDGFPNGRDEHLLPGYGSQPCAEALNWLGEYHREHGYEGVVCLEVSTRKAKNPGEREEWLRYALDFAHTHLGQ